MSQKDGIMAQFEQEAHSFVIRLWPEYQEQETAVLWRGWVEHVQSGQRHYFQDVQGLHTAVGHYLSCVPDLQQVLSSLTNSDDAATSG